jgi:hypothetical protein
MRPQATRVPAVLAHYQQRAASKVVGTVALSHYEERFMPIIDRAGRFAPDSWGRRKMSVDPEKSGPGGGIGRSDSIG